MKQYKVSRILLIIERRTNLCIYTRLHKSNSLLSIPNACLFIHRDLNSQVSILEKYLSYLRDLAIVSMSDTLPLEFHFAPLARHLPYTYSGVFGCRLLSRAHTRGDARASRRELYWPLHATSRGEICSRPNEFGLQREQKRYTHLYHSILCSYTLILVAISMGKSIWKIMESYGKGKGYRQMCLLCGTTQYCTIRPIPSNTNNVFILM